MKAGRPIEFGVLLLAISILVVAPVRAHETDAKDALEDTDAAAQASDRLQEIIVTARRRPEPLQRTPASVIALSAEDLESRSVTNLRSLQAFVPNLTLAASQSVGEAAGNAFIRGIGQEDFVAGSEPGVAFYLDGVYIATTRGTLMNLGDVARIEVLRGPQGTLFGKNSIGGAIQLVSVKPQREAEGRVGAILGNYDRAELRGVLNQPLAGNLFARLSLAAVSRHGYLRRLPPPVPLGPLFSVKSDREGDDRSQAGRLQLRWLVNDTLTADFSVDGMRKRNAQGAIRVDEIDPRFGIFPTLNRLISEGKLPGPEITNALLPDSFLESYAGGKNVANLDNWGISATLTEDFGAAGLKLILAYRNLRTRIGTDSDGLYFNILGSEFRDKQQQYSAEVQLNGSAGPLVYTAGLFAFREDAESLPATGIGQNEVLFTCKCFFTPANRPPQVAVHRDLRSESYAFFAQATYQLAERLSATVGKRHAYERKSIAAETLLVDLDTLLPTRAIAATGANRDDWRSLTWRAGFEFQATADAMIYASAAKGYKSGGFNVRPVVNLPNLGVASFAPETALTYEIGLRSEWLDRKLRLNATLFHSDYENIQLRQQTLAGGIVTTLIENAASARIRGAELELTAAPADGLVVSAAYGHLDPKYLDVGLVPGITLASRFQRTPRHSLSASATYAAALATGAIELHADYGYRSKEQFQITATPYDQPGYGLLGARATFRTTNDRWSFAVFGTNLTDQRYRAAGRATQIGQTGIAMSSIGMPRQVGVQISTRF